MTRKYNTKNEREEEGAIANEHALIKVIKENSNHHNYDNISNLVLKLKIFLLGF